MTASLLGILKTRLVKTVTTTTVGKDSVLVER